MAGHFVAGVDVGSTFTDLVLLDTRSGELSHRKVLSTPGDQSRGFLTALLQTSEPLSDFAAIVHGTTVATNASIERKGGPVALVTTAGFRDVIELRNRTRPSVYGLGGTFEPLVPRQHRYEVRERIDADGTEIDPLDELRLRELLREARESGCDALAISFLHSYVDDQHEVRAQVIAQEEWPNDHISLGSELAREIREFERTSTAVANAYVQPPLSRYLGNVDSRLREAGFEGELLIVQSNGGLTSVAEAQARAVTTILSGPAAGVAAATRVAGELGHQSFVTMDMGGTSLDLAVIANGVATFADEKEVQYGVPMRLPTLDIETVGIGGGSIAHIDDAGILAVGPASAGSDPGPAAYGRGGELPTVTDANVVLGRIGLTSGLGFETGLRLGRAAAEQAMLRHVGDPLGLDATEAAGAVLAVTANAMSGHVRRLTVERGHDPRDFALVAFGGAGPLHAAFVMLELGLKAVLVPSAPGVLSAEGCAVGDIRYDFVQTLHLPLAEVSEATLLETHRRAVQAGRDRLALIRSTIGRIEVLAEADLLFAGQTHTLRVPVPSERLSTELVERAFRDAYRSRYGRLLDLPVMLMNLRTMVIGRRLVTINSSTTRQVASKSHVGKRRVYFDGEVMDVPIFTNAQFGTGVSEHGPFIVEKPDSTVVVPPGVQAERLPSGAFILQESS